MAIQAVPFALQNAQHSSALFRQSSSAAFVNGGVLANNELVVTQAASPAMSVLVTPGRAKVVGNSLTAPTGAPTGSYTWTTQGMYDVLNDATATLTISSSDPTNPRIDLVYIQVQDAFYTGSANQAVLQVLAGTPASSPAAPSLPVNSIALANVRVNASATTITTANITNLASVATIMGQVVVYQTKALLTAATGMKTNDLAAVVADSTTANNAFYFYNGSAWTILTATSFDASAITSGTIDSARLPTVPVTKGGTGATSLTGNSFVITNSGGTALTTTSTVSLTTNVAGTLPVANGGTGVSSMTTGFIKYNGSAVVSGQPVVASDISATEQANINAGGLYSGGVTTPNANSISNFNIFVQSAQPSSGVTTGDLWFW
jgi:hypothetical protein